MRKFSIPILSTLLVLMLLPGLAYASSGNDDIASLLLSIYRGIVGGEYFYAAAISLSLLTVLARRAWGTTGLTGAAILFTASIAGTFSVALGAGQEVTWSLTWIALSLAINAAGGYSVLQVIARRIRPWLERHTPGALIGLVRLLLNLVDPPVPPASTSSTRAATAPFTVALLLGLLMVASCATARHAAGAGAAAGLDCQAESIQATVHEAGVLARAFVLGTISGTGDVDTAALRAAARGMKSAALRCSLVAALAAVAAAADGASDPAAPQTLGLQPDPQQLRAAVRELASGEWGIEGPVLVGGERL